MIRFEGKVMAKGEPKRIKVTAEPPPTRPHRGDPGRTAVLDINGTRYRITPAELRGVIADGAAALPQADELAAAAAKDARGVPGGAEPVPSYEVGDPRQ